MCINRMVSSRGVAQNERQVVLCIYVIKLFARRAHYHTKSANLSPLSCGSLCLFLVTFLVYAVCCSVKVCVRCAKLVEHILLGMNFELLYALDVEEPAMAPTKLTTRVQILQLCVCVFVRRHCKVNTLQL